MNKLMIVMALVMLGGCMAEEPAYEGVASQESAVEETPAPTPEEDMRIRQLYVACYNSCGNVFFSCMFIYCHMAVGSNCAAQADPDRSCSCEDSCSGEQSSCWAGCSNLFNHL